MTHLERPPIALGFSFDGVDDYISCPDASLKSKAFTLEAQVIFKALHDGVIIGKFNNGFMWLDIDYLRVEFRNEADTAWRGIPQDGGVSYSPSVGVWYHIVGTFGGAGTTIRLCVNGELVSETGVIDEDPLIVDEILAVGRWGTSASRYLNGIVPLACTYNRALSLEEISDLYNIRRNIMNGCVLKLGTVGLVRGGGTQWLDESPYKNHGTAYGAKRVRCCHCNVPRGYGT